MAYAPLQATKVMTQDPHKKRYPETDQEQPNETKRDSETGEQYGDAHRETKRPKETETDRARPASDTETHKERP
jgi:hypothetical protein